MAKVTDGMRVSTESPDAVQARRSVLSLLLERYPGDHLRNGPVEEDAKEGEEKASVRKELRPCAKQAWERRRDVTNIIANLFRSPVGGGEM